MHHRQIYYNRGYEKSNLKNWIKLYFYVPILISFGISRFFLIHHKLYSQDDHSLNFFVIESWFSIFFTNLFYQFCWQYFDNILTIFFTKNYIRMVILMAMLMANHFFLQTSDLSHLALFSKKRILICRSGWTFLGSQLLQNTSYWFGKVEENRDLSRIYLDLFSCMYQCL